MADPGQQGEVAANLAEVRSRIAAAAQAAGRASAAVTLIAVAKGQPPVAAVVDGAFLVVAGALLITPGLISDTVAILLLIPPVRHLVARWLVYAMMRRAQVSVGVFQAATEARGPHGPSRPPSGEGPVIEGEFERMDEKATGPHRRIGSDGV